LPQDSEKHCCVCISVQQSEASDAACSSAVGIAAVSMTAVSVAGVGVDTRKTLRLSKSDRKIGHWRVDNDGQVTYKKVRLHHCLCRLLFVLSIVLFFLACCVTRDSVVMSKHRDLYSPDNLCYWTRVTVVLTTFTQTIHILQSQTFPHSTMYVCMYSFIYYCQYRSNITDN